MQKGKEGKRGPGVEKGIQGEITALPRQNLKIFAVAIDEYEHANYWPKLEYPVTDCKRLLAVLKDWYGAECVVELYDKDATFEKVKRDILDLTKGGTKELVPEDDLIILFSGHSYRSHHGVGGFVMHDSGDADKPQERDKMINPTWLFNQFKQMFAWRILLVVDTCYGLQFSKVQVDSLPDSGGLPLRPGRWTLSSSRDGESPDYSRFMRGITRLLYRNEEEQLLLAKLVGELKTDLQNFEQDLPEQKNLVTDDKLTGDFVFSRKMPEPYPKKSHLEFLELLRKGSSKYLEALSQGRFCYMRIEELLPGTDSGKLMPTEVEVAEIRMPLTTVVREKRKETSKPHVLLLGDGGMGKTTSLLNLWERMMTCQEDPIPIFIALNEYNQARKGAQKNFLTWYIAKHYLGVKDPDPYLVEDQLWNLLQVNPIGGQPQITLLLDGFNEVSSDQTALLEELSWASKAKNVQIVLTSRYVETRRFIWAQRMEEVRLLPLEEDLIRQYLAANNLDYPKDSRLQSVITNPMMLASYAKTEHLANTYGGEHSPYFFYEAKTEAEILWNFNEALLAKAMDNPGDADNRNEDEKNSLKENIVRKLLPYLAWRMEKEGLFLIPLESNSHEQLSFDSIVMEAFVELADMELALAQNKGNATGRGITSKEKRKGIEQILNILKEQLHMLIQEGKELRFLHQNFRDFYAACHLLNCIKFSLTENKRPDEWKERALPIYLRKMIGELEGEYLFKPCEIFYSDTWQSRVPEKIKNNNLSKLLNINRQTNDTLGGSEILKDYTVWNLVMVILEGRGTLAGANLSSLNLRGLVLNKVKLSYSTEKKTIAANLHRAKVDGKQFVIGGHLYPVFSAKYNKIGTHIVTSSKDTAIEWIVETGESTGRFSCFYDKIVHASYHPIENRIITISNKLDVIKWNRPGLYYSKDEIVFGLGKTFSNSEDYEVIFTRETEPEENIIKSAVISDDLNHLLRVGIDKEFEIWLPDRDKSTKSIQKTNTDTRFICYSPNKKDYIHVGIDGSVTEISISTGNVVNIYKYPNEKATYATYSPDGKRILVISRDYFVEEYYKGILFPNDSFEIHSSRVTSACYSPDGIRILIAQENGIIKEWLCGKNKCINTFNSFESVNHSISYNPGGNRFLIAAKMGHIQEWDIAKNECINSFVINENIEIDLINETSNGAIKIILEKNRNIEIWDSKREKCISKISQINEEIESIIISKNGLNFLTINKNGDLKEWCGKTGNYKFSFLGHRSKIVKAIYSNSNKRILTISLDRSIKEWDSHSGQCKNTFLAHKSNATFATYNKLDSQILVISEDGSAELFDVKYGYLLRIFPKTKAGYSTASFNFDGKSLYLGTMDGKINKFTTKDFSHHETIVVHSGKVSSIAFSVTLGCFATTSNDGTIKIWDQKDNIPIQEIVIDKTIDHSNLELNSLCFSNDGRTITLTQPNGFQVKFFLDSFKRYSKDKRDYRWDQRIQSEKNHFLSPGFYVQGLDLRNLHPDSIFTDEEKERMRRYGAIFTDQDKADWEAAVEDSYGDMEE